MSETIHNLDQYMSDLRQILAQGRKRIGILIGAGAPLGINVNTSTDKPTPLIPAIEGLTEQVMKALPKAEKSILESVLQSVEGENNIEYILSKVRSLSAALKGSELKINNYDQSNYNNLATLICQEIGKIVSPALPSNNTPYNRLSSWIGGTDREHSVEIFTSNYDLLMEEALEYANIPFFTGFSGSYEPFFDPATIANNDELPPRWARLWKLHGSLGWGFDSKNELISGKGREATELIYPDHLKYDHIKKLPYTALFERLTKFLMTPDTLLLSCGFSFNDAHISAVISEALSANPSASVFGFLYNELGKEEAAKNISLRRPNFSAYASDKAVISCVEGKWELGRNDDNKDWASIRKSFWNSSNSYGMFVLGDFTAFAEFFALSKSDQTYSSRERMNNAETI